MRSDGVHRRVGLVRALAARGVDLAAQVTADAAREFLGRAGGP